MKYHDNRVTKSFLILLIFSTGWLWLYLVLICRYPLLFQKVFPFLEFRTPLFSADYSGSDFYGPMGFSASLAPYEEKYGNSPPFLMFLSWLFSIADKNGIYWELMLLCCWLVSMTFLFYSIYKTGEKNGQSASVSALCAFALMLSFPSLYCFDRGNFVFLVATLVAVAFYTHEKGHTYLSAVLIGLAASIKLYPAILGVCFLARKEWKAACVCCLTGVLTSILPLFFFQGGFLYNLRLLIEKTSSYATVGNGNIAWLIDDKNSFYQLFLIPKMLGPEPLTDIESLSSYVSGFRYVVFALSAFLVLLSMLFSSESNRLLLLTMVMIGFPIESGAYNLILVLYPLANWCLDSTNLRSVSIMILGVLLITMKSFVSINGNIFPITPQAIFNPLIELAITILLVLAERTSIKNSINGFFMHIHRQQIS